MSTINTPMPTLRIDDYKPSDKYKTWDAPTPIKIKGWDELNHWGRCNNPIWSNVRDQCSGMRGLSEVDALKLLAFALLQENENLIHRLTTSEWISKSAPTIIIPKEV